MSTLGQDLLAAPEGAGGHYRNKVPSLSSVDLGNQLPLLTDLFNHRQRNSTSSRLPFIFSL